MRCLFCCVVIFLGVSAPARGDFVYNNFSSTAGLSLVGSAAQSGNTLRLNPANPATAGGAWYVTKQQVKLGFETNFSFQITNPGGTGGDGFAFIVQNSGPTALGLTNSYMGYEIANSLAVEFDTFLNANLPGIDPNGNHVGVQSRGTLVNTPFAPGFLGSAAIAPAMSDGNVHLGRVTYTPGTLSIFVDNLVAPALTISVDLSTLLNLDSGHAFVGFTGGGSSAFENHDILSWRFASVPEPASAWISIVAVASILVRRRRR